MSADTVKVCIVIHHLAEHVGGIHQGESCTVGLDQVTIGEVTQVRVGRGSTRDRHVDSAMEDLRRRSFSFMSPVTSFPAYAHGEYRFTESSYMPRQTGACPFSMIRTGESMGDILYFTVVSLADFP